MWLSAGLYGAALLISLFVQTNMSILAGMWLFPCLIACWIMTSSPPLRYGIGNPVWESALAWLLAIGFATFVVQPIGGGAAVGWVLAAGPMVAVSMRPQFMKPCLTVSLAIICLFSAGLIAQVLLRVHYTVLDYPSHFGWSLPAWPLIDPNNAACIVVMALVPLIHQTLKTGGLGWLFITLLCGTALLLTESKAGVLALGAACFVMLCGCKGRLTALKCLLAGLLAVAAALPFYWYQMTWAVLNSLRPRMDIWGPSMQLLWVHPWRGLGLSMFHVYYAALRTEIDSGGFYLHNDFVQLAMEMGFPCLLPLLALAIALMVTTCRHNLPAACTLLAVAIMASLEFQIYLPSVSLLCGVALAYHIQHRPLAQPPLL